MVSNNCFWNQKERKKILSLVSKVQLFVLRQKQENTGKKKVFPVCPLHPPSIYSSLVTFKTLNQTILFTFLSHVPKTILEGCSFPSRSFPFFQLGPTTEEGKNLYGNISPATQWLDLYRPAVVVSYFR